MISTRALMVAFVITWVIAAWIVGGELQGLRQENARLQREVQMVAHCQEDEAIWWIGPNTRGCVHVEKGILGK